MKNIPYYLLFLISCNTQSKLTPEEVARQASKERIVRRADSLIAEDFGNIDESVSAIRNRSIPINKRRQFIDYLRSKYPEYMTQISSIYFTGV